jgi:hypothetical protein
VRSRVCGGSQNHLRPDGGRVKASTAETLDSEGRTTSPEATWRRSNGSDERVELSSGRAGGWAGPRGPTPNEERTWASLAGLLPWAGPPGPARRRTGLPPLGANPRGGGGASLGSGRPGHGGSSRIRAPTRNDDGPTPWLPHPPAAGELRPRSRTPGSGGKWAEPNGGGGGFGAEGRGSGLPSLGEADEGDGDSARPAGSGQNLPRFSAEAGGGGEDPAATEAQRSDSESSTSEQTGERTANLLP